MMKYLLVQHYHRVLCLYLNSFSLQLKYFIVHIKNGMNLVNIHATNYNLYLYIESCHSEDTYVVSWHCESALSELTVSFLPDVR